MAIKRIKFDSKRKPKFGLNIKTRFKASKEKAKSGQSDAPVKRGYNFAWVGPGHLTINPYEHLSLYQTVLLPREIERDYNNTKEGRAQLRVLYQGESWLRVAARERGINWDARASSPRRNQPELIRLAKETGLNARTIVTALRQNWSTSDAEREAVKGLFGASLNVKSGDSGSVIRVANYDRLDGAFNDLAKLVTKLANRI